MLLIAKTEMASFGLGGKGRTGAIGLKEEIANKGVMDLMVAYLRIAQVPATQVAQHHPN